MQDTQESYRLDLDRLIPAPLSLLLKYPLVLLLTLVIDSLRLQDRTKSERTGIQQATYPAARML